MAAKEGEYSVRVTAKTKEYDEALKGLQQTAERTRKKLEQGNSTIKKMGRSIKADIAGGLASATENAGGLGKGLSQVFKGGLGPMAIFSAALAAIKGIFDNLISKSQTFGDTIARVTAQAGAALSYAFDPSNWGEGFVDGLKEAMAAAGQLADASDAVGTHLIEWQAKEARLNDTLAESQAIITDTTSTEEQRAQAIEKAQAAAAEYAQGVKTLNDARRQEIDMIIKDTAAQSRLALSQEEVNFIMSKGIEDVDAMVAAGGNLAKFADAMSDDTHRKLVEARAQINQLDKAANDFNKRVAILTKREAKAETKVQVKLEPAIPEGSYAAIKKKIAALQKQLELTIPASIEDYRIRTEIDMLNEQLKGESKPVLSLKAALDVKSVTEGLQLVKRDVKEVTDYTKTLEGVQGVFGSLGQMVQAVGQSSQEAAVGVQALAIAEQIAAMASAIYNASKGDPYTVAARVIAAAAAITSAIVTIQSLSKRNGFAEGGVVQGQFESGDRQIIAVNAGEMILTKSQQSHLFDMINKPMVAGGQGGQVTFRVEGRDLVGVLEAYGRYNQRSI